MTGRGTVKTPEGLVKDDIRAGLASIGAYVFQPVQFGFGKRGVDFHCTLPPNGKALLIEAKRPDGGKLTRIQRKTLDDNVAAGGISVVAMSWFDVENAIAASIKTEPA